MRHTSRSGPGRALASLVLLLLLLTVSRNALADAVPRVVPGQRLWGRLARDERVAFAIDGVPGMSITVVCTRWRGSDLQPRLAISGPDGAPIDLSAVRATTQDGRRVTVKRLAIDRTGAYVVTIDGAAGTEGGFDLAISAQRVVRISGSTADQGPDGHRTVVAYVAGGDRVRCSVRASRGLRDPPGIVQVRSSDGALQRIEPPRSSVVVEAPVGGTVSFDVSAAASIADIPYTVSIRPARPSRHEVAIRDIAAVGAISGRVAVPGGDVNATSVIGHRAARVRSKGAGDEIRPGEVIVWAPSATRCADLLREARQRMPDVLFTEGGEMSAGGPYLLRAEHLVGRAPSSRLAEETVDLARQLARRGTCRAAEPNFVLRGFREPNDPEWPNQRHLRDIGMPDAWDVAVGGSTVAVAVVDSGIWPHPDLDENILAGFDFISDPSNAADGDGRDADPTDDAHDFHGTHVAGIVGAVGNNRIGVCGAAWYPRILPVRVLGKDGGSSFDVAAAIRWAAGLAVTGVPANTTPARVINLSLGSTADSQAVRDAVSAARASGAVVVAAAGNSASSTPFYPAALQGVVGVGAVDSNASLSSFSNSGTWISVVAPGGDARRGLGGILSTYVSGTTLEATYAELEGTSQAAPQVASVAALILQVNPQLQESAVKDIIEQTALDLGPPGFDADFGHGLVDAAAALRAAPNGVTPASTLRAVPSELKFGALAPRLSAYVTHSGPGTVEVIRTETREFSGHGWLFVESFGTSTPATIGIKVEHGRLGLGTYAGNVRVITSSGALDIPVRVVHTPAPVLDGVVVSAIAADGSVAGVTSTTADRGWRYELDALPLGRYQVRAAHDVTGNLKIDRVDEWEGAWPTPEHPGWITLSAEVASRADADVVVQRYDEQFTFDGVGGGPIRGAVAVRVEDSETRAPIPAATVLVGDGIDSALTDTEGRAVVVGPFLGAQTVSVVAPGRATATRIGFNGQYQGFRLEPAVEPAPVRVHATVRGLRGDEAVIWLQVGAHLVDVAATGTDLDVEVDVPPAASVAPVAALGYDSDGRLVSIARSTPPEGGIDQENSVVLDAMPVAEQSAGRSILPVLPATVLDAATARTRAALYGGDSLLGAVTFPASAKRNLVTGTDEFGAPGTWLWLEASDPSGATSGVALRGAATALGSSTIALPAPIVQTSPPDGALVSAIDLRLLTSPSADADLVRINLTDKATRRRWFVLRPATDPTRLPNLPTGGLRSGAAMTWSIEATKLPSFRSDSLLSERITSEWSWRTTSRTAEFRVQ